MLTLVIFITRSVIVVMLPLLFGVAALKLWMRLFLWQYFIKVNDGKITDISKTSVCPLARVMRRELKSRGVKSLPVVYSEEVRDNGGARVPATIAYMPAIAGLLAAEQVMKHLCGTQSG